MMVARKFMGLSLWAVSAPLVALATLIGVWGRALEWLALILVAAALSVAVLAAVHHAEVVAHKVGEPYGTLILALAVTVIEVSLIVSMMVSGGESADTLARDTVFAAVMIVCTGVLGLCLLVGGIRHHVVEFRVEGSVPTLSVLIALATLTLVLPALTVTTPEPTFSTSQLAFAGIASLVLYGVFVFVQTVRHREYFLPLASHLTSQHDAAHAAPSSSAAAFVSLGFLFACLIAVVGLAKTLAPTIEAVVKSSGAPVGVVGIVIALLVLLPETWAAVRAASADRMQTSLNLTLGSALATIGLTIPTVAVLAISLPMPLVLGLPPKEIALLMLTFLVSALTLGGGRSTILQGAVHLVLFATFIFLAVVP